MSTATLYCEPAMTLERVLDVVDEALKRDSHFYVYDSGEDKVVPMLPLRQAVVGLRNRGEELETLGLMRKVLNDFFESEQPRSFRHCIDSLKRISDGTEPWPIMDAAASLATPNALLERWVNAPEITQHEYLSGRADMNLGTETRAYLAAQPATAPTEVRPAVTAEQAQQDALHALNRRYHRHEAEQRVLDAMGAIPKEDLDWTIELQAEIDERSPAVVVACRAELARRGLKP